MTIATRTDDGFPIRCGICGKSSIVNVSRPPGDAVCPSCGSFLWVDSVIEFTRQNSFVPDFQISNLPAPNRNDAIHRLPYATTVELHALSSPREFEKRRLKDVSPFVILADVAIMFAAMFFANAANWWIFFSFHVIAMANVAFVLYMANRASKVIRPTFMFQRPLGVALYISVHIVKFGFSGEVSLTIVGYLLLAYPLAVLFLFDGQKR